MDTKFDNIPGAIELSNDDLTTIQGGSLFGDVWRQAMKARSGYVTLVKEGQPRAVRASRSNP